MKIHFFPYTSMLNNHKISQFYNLNNKAISIDLENMYFMYKRGVLHI